MYPGDYPRGGASNYGYPGQEGYDRGYGSYGGGGYQDPYVESYMGGYGGQGYGYGGGMGGWDSRLDYAYDVPPVSWMPQQGWGGFDFARAQGGRGISQGYWDEFQSGMGGWFDNYVNDEGFARQAHRLVYMMRDLFNARSRELGAAAAYEAYLKWDRAQYERSWGRRGFEGRDGLMGFAFGEAHRLCDRMDLDLRRREKVLRYATATAHNLWNDQWDDYSDYATPYGGGSRRLVIGGGGGLGRRGSFGGGRDPYYDGGMRGRRRSFDDGYGGGSMGMIGGPGGMGMGGGSFGGGGGMGMGYPGGGYPGGGAGMGIYDEDYRRGGGMRDGPLQIGYGGSYGPRGW